MAPMFIDVVMLPIQGGDCISFLFADQQTKDCCARGKCSRAEEADPCCQSSLSSSMQCFQPEPESSTVLLSMVTMPLPVDFDDPLDLRHRKVARIFGAPFHSPPDPHA